MRFSPLHLAFVCSALVGCLGTPIKRVSDSQNTRDVEAELDASSSGDGGSTLDAGSKDAEPPPACTRDEDCTEESASRCDLAQGTCQPCEKASECARFDAKLCVPGTGCVECTQDDASACTGQRKLCDAASYKCVECTEDDTSACDGTTAPFCVNNACSECRDQNDCPNATTSACRAPKCGACEEDNECTHLTDTPVCNADKGECVECKVNADCQDWRNPFCDTATNTCQPCTSHEQCDGRGERNLCSPAGACVQCTADNRDHCKTQSGDPAVCDALQGLCSDKALGSADLCEPCVSDAQCQVGQKCVETSTVGQEVVWACLWIRNGGGSAPQFCDPDGRPFVKSTAATSIDDRTTSVQLCSLSVSTCSAFKTHKRVCGAFELNGTVIHVDHLGDPDLPDDVRNNDARKDEIYPDDSACGVGGVCVAQDATIAAYRCSMPCVYDTDCLALYTCQGTPRFCSVN